MTLPSEIADATEPGSTRGRVVSIDLVRGLVMVLMVLDHVRDFFGDARSDPTDLASTTPALFFTRWATHFCAPSFIFLAGISASLSGLRKGRGQLSRHLIVRGLWLIFLEQTWESVTIFFAPPQFVLALVLWAIGWSMIVLAGLIYLPRAAIGGIGLAMIAFHNMLDGIPAGDGILGTTWSLLHVRGFRVLPGGIPILIGYPLIPWVGVMAAGYALGPIFVRPGGYRRPALLAIGLAATAGFFALRWTNLYGDPQPWQVRADGLFSAMSFLNCQKYPPSLLFLLMTLGPILLLLAALDRGLGRAGRPLETIGQVPLFYYLLQWPLAHGLAVAFAWSQGLPFKPDPGFGFGLKTVYIAWPISVGLLYLASRRYATWRRRRS